jgi:hypothetical protein
MMQVGRGARGLASLLGNLRSVSCRQAMAASTATYDVGSATNIKWHEGMVSREQKEQLLGQKVRGRAADAARRAPAARSLLFRRT